MLFNTFKRHLQRFYRRTIITPIKRINECRLLNVSLKIYFNQKSLKKSDIINANICRVYDGYGILMANTSHTPL